jgi:hypothetical protein
MKYELKKVLVIVGCPAHILQNSIQHGADMLLVENECIIIKVYNYFPIYAVRAEDLKSYCEFVYVNNRRLLSHSRTRWLLLLSAVKRLLQTFTAVKSFFSHSNLP